MGTLFLVVPVLSVSRDLPRQPASPFERGPKERVLRLLIDWDAIPGGPARQLLQELADASLFDAVGVTDLLCRASFQSHDGADVLVNSSPDFGFVGLGRSEDFRWEAERLAEVGSAECEQALLNARLAAYSCDTFDALVSGSPLFTGRTRAGINVLTAEQALPVVGLYLRSRSSHEWTNSHRTRRSPEDFYWLFARCLLPGSQALIDAAARNYRWRRDGEVIHLASSFVAQLARALRARDQLQVLMRSSGNADSSFDIGMSFDAALVYMAAAFDSLAGLCDIAYALGTKRMRRKWQLGDWMSRLRASAGSSVANAADLPEVKDVRDLIACLRNTIHGPVLQPTVMIGSRGDRVVILVPAEEVSGLEDALRKWPFPPSWWGCTFIRLGPPEEGETIRMGGPDDPVAEIQIDPCTCLERLLPLTVRALSRLIEPIEWDRLAGPEGADRISCGLPPVEPALKSRVLLLGGID